MKSIKKIASNAGAISMLWILLSVINKGEGSKPGPIDKIAMTIAMVCAVLIVVTGIVRSFAQRGKWE